MSLYHYNLKKEIKHYQESIKRNKENMETIKTELFTGDHIHSYRAHKSRYIDLIFHDIRLKEKLERIIRLVH